MTTKLSLLVVIFLVANPLVAATLINGSQTGANSVTYSRNYEDMVAGMLNTGFNTTKQYSTGGLNYLAVPEFSSSTSCVMNASGLATAYAGSGVNSTFHEVRSDAFTETGIVLAMSNQTAAFDAWYNFLVAMDKDCAGSLPCWVVIRNNTRVDLPSGGNDTAIDGSVRAGIALYLAVNNTAFSAGNRTKYLTLANQLAADSYAYETITITTKATRSGINVTRIPMGGSDCAAAGIGCSTDQWIGYGGDIIKFFQYACYFTTNQTFCAAAANFTLAFLSANLQNDTDGDGFGVAPFNFNWNTAGTYLGHTDGGGVNSYHYSAANSQWDDSDSPRFENFCDSLRVANLTGQTGTVWTNLSAYCRSWANSGTLTNTTSCLQYYYNGTCSTTIRNGYYENGLGAMISTYFNTSFVKPKVDEILTHYSWSGNTMDSTSCGTAGMFRASKSTKALGTAIGNDERWYSSSSGGSPAVNYTLTVTMNNTNTSTAITSFCAGVSGTSCTTNGTVYITQLNNGTYNLSYTSATLRNSSVNITVAGNTAYTIQEQENPSSNPPVVNYTLTVTMNDTNTSTAVTSFCATISSQLCTTNGTLHFAELNNGTYNLSYTSATLQNSSRNVTVAGNTAYTIQEQENPVTASSPSVASPTDLTTCESMANATGKIWMILMGIALLVLLSITRADIELDPLVIGGMITAATMGLLIMAIGTGLICQI